MADTEGETVGRTETVGAAGAVPASRQANPATVKPKKATATAVAASKRIIRLRTEPN